MSKKPDFKIMDVVHFSKYGLTQIKPYKSMIGVITDIQGDFLRVDRKGVKTVRWWFWEYWEHYLG